jgi:hypothetical protein
MSCFHAYGQVSQRLKKNYIVFSYNKKIQKFVLAFILALTSLLKLWKLDQYFKNKKKNILFSFII